MASIQKFLTRCKKAHLPHDQTQKFIEANKSQKNGNQWWCLARSKSKLLGVTIPKPFQFDKKQTKPILNLRHSQESFHPRSIGMQSPPASSRIGLNGFSTSKLSVAQSGVSAFSRSSGFSSKSIKRPVEDNLAVHSLYTGTTEQEERRAEEQNKDWRRRRREIPS